MQDILFYSGFEDHPRQSGNSYPILLVIFKQLIKDSLNSYVFYANDAVQKWLPAAERALYNRSYPAQDSWAIFMSSVPNPGPTTSLTGSTQLCTESHWVQIGNK